MYGSKLKAQIYKSLKVALCWMDWIKWTSNQLKSRGMFPRVFGDEFGDKFGDEFGDKFSELPNLVIILVMNLVNCQIR